MSATTIQILINGENAQGDFIELVSRMIEKALANVVSTSAPRDFIPDFNIEPQMMYKLSDERIHKLFGVDALKRPELSIMKVMRKVGIEPMANRKSGTMVFGHQILDYMQKIDDVQHSYLKSN